MRFSHKSATLLVLAALIALTPIFFPSSFYYRIGSLIFINGLAVTGMVRSRPGAMAGWDLRAIDFAWRQVDRPWPGEAPLRITELPKGPGGSELGLCGGLTLQKLAQRGHGLPVAECTQRPRSFCADPRLGILKQRFEGGAKLAIATLTKGRDRGELKGAIGTAEIVLQDLQCLLPLLCKTQGSLGGRGFTQTMQIERAGGGDHAKQPCDGKDSCPHQLLARIVLGQRGMAARHAHRRIQQALLDGDHLGEGKLDIAHGVEALGRELGQQALE